MAYYPMDKNPSGLLFVGDPGANALLASVTDVVYDSGQGFLGINVAQPEFELDVSGTGAFREIRFADGSSQTSAYNWTITDGVNSESVADNETIKFTGAGSTSVGYNTSTNTVTITTSVAGYNWDLAAGNETSQTIDTGETVRFSGLDGIEITQSPANTINVDLKDTAVTPGSYGDASTISTFTVDQQGRLTAAGETSVSITASQVSDFASQVSGVVFDANNFVDSTTIDFTVLDGVNVTGAVKTNSISEDYLTTSVAGDGLAGGNGTPLSVSTDGTTIETNGDAIRIAATAAGDGLAGGGGSALSVNVDDTTIEINSDTLRVKDSGITESKISRTVQYNPVPVGELTFDINMVSGAQEAYTLPTATLNTGKIVRVKKTDQAASSVRISGNAVGELIDSGNIYFLYNYNESVTLICDGSDWQVF